MFILSIPHNHRRNGDMGLASAKLSNKSEVTKRESFFFRAAGLSFFFFRCGRLPLFSCHSTCPSGASRAETEESGGAIGHREAARTQRLKMRESLRIIYFTHIAALSTDKMDVAPAGEFVAGVVHIKKQASDNPATTQQLHGAIDCGTAHMVALFFKRDVDILHFEMGT